MIDVQSCRQHAADCVRQAHGEDSAGDKNILLNVALAWLRLGHQAQELSAQDSTKSESVDEDDSSAEAGRRELVS
jgi:hypothetical protein